MNDSESGFFQKNVLLTFPVLVPHKKTYPSENIRNGKQVHNSGIQSALAITRFPGLSNTTAHGALRITIHCREKQSEEKKQRENVFAHQNL